MFGCAKHYKRFLAMASPCNTASSTDTHKVHVQLFTLPHSVFNQVVFVQLLVSFGESLGQSKNDTRPVRFGMTLI